jgi:hypothetical protein
MLYIILQKNLHTDCVAVHSVYDDEGAAVDEINNLIDSDETHGYRMDSVVMRTHCAPAQEALI